MIKIQAVDPSLLCCSNLFYFTIRFQAYITDFFYFFFIVFLNLFMPLFDIGGFLWEKFRIHYFTFKVEIYGVY